MGALIGAWQGFWIAYVGIPSFIVTLGGMLVFRGATQYLLEGQSIAPMPRGLEQVSSGFLPEMGTNAVYHWPTVILGAVMMVAAVVGPPAIMSSEKTVVNVLPFPTVAP